ncbi:hypothetical protein M758_4G214800 [Ceratodon purpureus]|uniref:Uncharacterized protein n=1 Tax=Ceratodon purpureus TaxID=3225 RepID=A0A8T0IDF1_CERPU|nr:hypothetical protein KC19_4G211900 [Ceratodon purpureus]KAG0620424.1 hypothetical protein M758_4G214800 [Ceratodon purpureus]
MENQMPNENRMSLDNDNAPLLGNLKRSSAMAALSPKERQRIEAKSFKMPAPVPPVLRERNKKGADVKRKTPPNPVKVPARSNLSYPERYMSPTDSLVSPVTKGVLARNRKPMRLLNPWGPPKALENTFQGTVNKPLAASKQADA